MPAGDAVDAIWDLAASTAFEATFVNTRAPFSGLDITAPITVACGGRDWILPRRSWFPGALPSHARWVLKHGWGHVPMWTDPLGVSELILEGTQRSSRAHYVDPSADIRYVPGVGIVA
jgi:pimeloyl-ACP methyl ester carboxylesterase